MQGYIKNILINYIELSYATILIFIFAISFECASCYKTDFELFFRSERGKYYALDLGGTNFRVLRIQLGGKRSSILSCDVERQLIPQDLMTSTSEVAFL